MVDFARAARFGQAREVFARQRRHARFEALGRHLDAGAALFGLEPHVGFGQRAHDLVEFFRRQRHRAGLFDRGLAAAAQRHFEIGGEQRQLVPVRLDEHVRQDRDGVLALDDLLEELQFPHKIGFPGDQFHGEVDLVWKGLRALVYRH